jgi:hypothetical protein
MDAIAVALFVTFLVGTIPRLVPLRLIQLSKGLFFLQTMLAEEQKAADHHSEHIQTESRSSLMCLEEFAKELGLEAHKIQRAFNALSGFAQSGFATTPPEALATREATCRACPEWDAAALNATGRCRKCGCSTWAKLRMATERCPLGKWGAFDTTPTQ